jgi:hypothetical protein
MISLVCVVRKEEVLVYGEESDRRSGRRARKGPEGGGEGKGGGGTRGGGG